LKKIGSGINIPDPQHQLLRVCAYVFPGESPLSVLEMRVPFIEDALATERERLESLQADTSDCHSIAHNQVTRLQLLG
jgi:hypothetical protein